MDTYISKTGQKSKRARNKDRRERRYLAECERVWVKPIAVMTLRQARQANARITPRTSALLEEWRGQAAAPAELARVLAMPLLATGRTGYDGMRSQSPRPRLAAGVTAL